MTEAPGERRAALFVDRDWPSSAALREVLAGDGWHVVENPGWDRLAGFHAAVMWAHYPSGGALLDLHRRWLVLDGVGVPSLNAPAAVARALDKSVAWRLFAHAGVPIPPTSLVRPGEPVDLPGDELVLKPLDGYGSHGVRVVAGASAARRALAGASTPTIVQARVPGRLRRVIATPREAVRCYALAMDERGITATPELQTRTPLELVAPEVERVAAAAVRALGGGLMGVDAIESGDGRVWVLEANAAFGFNRGDEAVAAALRGALPAAPRPLPASVRSAVRR